MDDPNRPYKGIEAAMFRIEALEAELARVTEDRDLWKQSEATCNAQYNKLGAEVARLRRIAKRIVEDVSSIDRPTQLSVRTVESIVFDARQALKGTDNAE